MENINIIQQEMPINFKLTKKNNPNTPSLEDLRSIVNLRFESISAFGRALGVSRPRASQILLGYHVPAKPELIKKIAEVLNLDIVKLTQLFDNIRSGEKNVNAN